MDNILEVKDLIISFRTGSGTLKAVRNISFTLRRGETLAIVGESGSGKSVTSRAILGILAGNAIVEGGEILYDGKDLLKIEEEEMHKIRGDKISMIFQNPLNSLNPIVKVGKQLTEAMLLKNAANRKAGKIEFNTMLADLKTHMIAASPRDAEEIDRLISDFDRFNIVAIKLEEQYNAVHTKLSELIGDIDDFLFRLSRERKHGGKERLKEMAKALAALRAPLLTDGFEADLSSNAAQLTSESASWINAKGDKSQSYSDTLVSTLGKVRALLARITTAERPNFFRIGYYVYRNPKADFVGMSVQEVNEITLGALESEFMGRFRALEEKGLRHSFDISCAKKQEVVAAIAEAKTFFKGDFTKSDAKKKCKELTALVQASIDRLVTVKDSLAYTFESSLSAAIDTYFAAVVNNPKEEKRFAEQSAKRQKLINAGKSVEWEVVPKSVYDSDALKAGVAGVLDRLEKKYTADIAASSSVDFTARGVEMIDYLKEKASQVVYKLTKRMAKEKAIKLLAEVGISEPRARFNQYPFELSGGMRQRIVIAIALSADPDILVCDEPTTALDVTIQAQIMELINKLKRERDLSVIFITHDLGVVANMADRIAVMYAGKIVEYGTADDLFYDPRHPYTWALLSSMPDLDSKDRLEAIPGTPPNMIYPPVGDAFADRNKYALKIDFEMPPPRFEISPTHWAATWLLHPDAPKVEIPKVITDRIAGMKQTGGADSGN
ncbi:MAG: ABC transporter ATP-binding protein [Clostridia bacterium]|nr:ABC transporter ATP-binding protein [Clostridia bacterium]